MACQYAVMAAVTIDHFVPRRASAEDLAVWSAIFSAGRGESSGGVVDAATLAAQLVAEEQLLADEQAGVRRWSARRPLGGPIVGVAELRPSDARTGFLRLFVAPEARRQGIGSGLVRLVLRGAATVGIERVQSTVLAGPPGEPFARSCPGLRVVLRLEIQEQSLTDATVLRRCREMAVRPRPGYRLVHWEGAAPEPLVASFGLVMGHVLDAPGAMFQMAARRWDPPKVREWEAKMTAAGSHLLVCAAVDLATESVVAATAVTVPAAGGPVADQHDTAVLPGHRRRGLARWLKADQAVRLHENFPEAAKIVVTLNQQNHPMLSVNRALGYHPVRERLLVEVAVNQAAVAR
jgi:GNAT superfamily N-acetyltransferase